MGIWKSLAGVYTVEITSASPVDALTAINRNGITLFDIVYIDALHVRGCVYRFDYKMFSQCLSKRGEEWTVIRNNGLYWTVGNLKRRPVLICGCLIFLIMVLYLPTRVLFVKVEGNALIPDKLIIENAEICGIRFWASRREVRSEKMKNALLSAVPQLQWAGVNTVGCVAVISVQERCEFLEKTKKHNVSSLIASQDAVIEEITVLHGNALCKPGQAVKRGQVLVSGYTDCGLFVKAEAAEAEIYGKTLRRLDAVSPVNYSVRSVETKMMKQYSLRIGKNIINFFKDSGISGAKCAKMYEEKILTLPGGFQLPFALITESISWHDYAVSAVDDDSSWVTQTAQNYLLSQMVAGQILDSDISIQTQSGVHHLIGHYSCREEIGQIRSEEKINING